MRIHREGRGSLRLVALALILFNLILALALGPAVLLVTIPLSLIAFGFFVQFFRNPLRVTPHNPQAVFSPADGTIVAIETIIEREYFHDERLKISIYMSALNVHLNRVPVTGEVAYTHYHKGKYLVAFHPKASELNERSSIVYRTLGGKELLVRQIAGTLARRIVTYSKPGQSVKAGDELGFIKFGSRCDVFLPVGTPVRVAMNDRVTGGETILAVWDETQSGK
jgi:phosphatidylserine decarboxylase